MIASCSRLGGGGKYSSLEHGSTSTGRSSGMSGHENRSGPDVSDGPAPRQLIMVIW